MYYGDFLVDKGLLSKENLLVCLCNQQENLPCLLRVVLDSKALAPDKIIEVIRWQIEEKKDMLSVLRERMVMEESQIQFLLERQSSYRSPLGQTAIKLGFLTQVQVEESFSAYLEALKHVEPNAPKMEQVEQSVEEIPRFEFSLIEDSMVTEYCDLFDEVKKQELEANVMSWVKSPDKETLRVFYRELHTIKGTSRFLKAFATEFIIHNVENLVSEITRSLDQLDESRLSACEDVTLKGLDLAWELRMAIRESAIEEDLWSDSNFISKVSQLLVNIKKQTDLLVSAQDDIDLDAFKDMF